MHRGIAMLEYNSFRLTELGSSHVLQSNIWELFLISRKNDLYAER